MPIQIRHANVADAPDMGKVLVDTWLSAHYGQVSEEQWNRRRNEWTYDVSENGWRRLLEEIASGENDQDCVFVAVADDEVVGVVVGSQSELNMLENAAEVSAVYVSPDCQGQGLGRRLIEAVAAHQARLGRDALIICALTTNTPARRFYEALSGQLIGTHETEDYGFTEMQVVYGWTDILELTRFSEVNCRH